eukprot:scaffold48_cov311-Pinguiococcus_pyrenoidosus.AAC.218
MARYTGKLPLPSLMSTGILRSSTRYRMKSSCGGALAGGTYLSILGGVVKDGPVVDVANGKDLLVRPLADVFLDDVVAAEVDQLNHGLAVAEELDAEAAAFPEELDVHGHPVVGYAALGLLHDLGGGLDVPAGQLGEVGHLVQTQAGVLGVVDVVLGREGGGHPALVLVELLVLGQLLLRPVRAGDPVVVEEEAAGLLERAEHLLEGHEAVLVGEAVRVLRQDHVELLVRKRQVEDGAAHEVHVVQLGVLRVLGGGRDGLGHDVDAREAALREAPRERHHGGALSAAQVQHGGAGLEAVKHLGHEDFGHLLAASVQLLARLGPVLAQAVVEAVLKLVVALPARLVRRRRGRGLLDARGHGEGLRERPRRLRLAVLVRQLGLRGHGLALLGLHPVARHGGGAAIWRARGAGSSATPATNFRLRRCDMAVGRPWKLNASGGVAA